MLEARNYAVVRVTAYVYPNQERGRSIDVVVVAVQDAKTLAGGTLMMVPLRRVMANKPGKKFCAVAQGKLIVSPRERDGRIPGGAVIKAELKR